MSTILNALRRVERNRLKDDRRIDLMRGLMNREQVVPKKRGWWTAALTGALLCVFISLITLFLSGYFDREEGMTGKAGTIAPLESPKTGPAHRSPAPAAQASRHPAEPESSGPEAGTSPAAGTDEPDAPKPSRDRGKTSSPPVAPSGTTSGQARFPGEKAAQPRVEKPALEISAIVWSPTPSDRFAMIDSRLVSEGDTVKGVRIDEIFEDGIRVEYKGESFTLNPTIY
ncbi:general secretion pathway protein GspB [Thermodesulfobacteriota bacterium]